MVRLIDGSEVVKHSGRKTSWEQGKGGEGTCTYEGTAEWGNIPGMLAKLEGVESNCEAPPMPMLSPMSGQGPVGPVMAPWTRFISLSRKPQGGLRGE